MHGRAILLESRRKFLRLADYVEGTGLVREHSCCVQMQVVGSGWSEPSQGTGSAQRDVGSAEHQLLPKQICPQSWKMNLTSFP